MASSHSHWSHIYQQVQPNLRGRPQITCCCLHAEHLFIPVTVDLMWKPAAAEYQSQRDFLPNISALHSFWTKLIGTFLNSCFFLHPLEHGGLWGESGWPQCLQSPVWWGAVTRCCREKPLWQTPSSRLWSEHSILIIILSPSCLCYAHSNKPKPQTEPPWIPQTPVLRPSIPTSTSRPPWCPKLYQSNRPVPVSLQSPQEVSQSRLNCPERK